MALPFSRAIGPTIYLATCDNYHLTRKNASYHLVIWNGQLWGGRFLESAL
jgi:hypothetical protein